jgi:hypothetical protein
MDGHQGPQGLNRIPPTGRLTVTQRIRGAPGAGLVSPVGPSNGDGLWQRGGGAVGQSVFGQLVDAG